MEKLTYYSIVAWNHNHNFKNFCYVFNYCFYDFYKPCFKWIKYIFRPYRIIKNTITGKYKKIENKNKDKFN